MEHYTFNTLKKGLGIRIIGGCLLDNKSSKAGIFIKNLMSGGLAEEEGILHEGDQIIEVNGKSFNSISNNKAVKLLREASATGCVQMTIKKDETSREMYEDLLETYSFSSASDSIDLPIFTDKPPTDGSLIRLTNENNLSIHPNTHINILKLKSSLKFLGFSPTPDQEIEMKKKLHTDINGNVSYGEFVQVAKEMFALPLNSHFRSYSINRMKKDNFSTKDFDDLKKENFNIKNQLQQKEKYCLKLEKQISKLRKDLQGCVDTNKDLKIRLNLSEEAQKAARYTEEDYEVILRLMETEMQRHQQLSVQDNNQDISLIMKEQIDKSRFHLKQMEIDLNLHKAANEKLINFVQFVQQTLSNRSLISLPSNIEFHVPLNDVLSLEARNTLVAVKTLLKIQDSSSNRIFRNESFSDLRINSLMEDKYL